MKDRRIGIRRDEAGKLLGQRWYIPIKTGSGVNSIGVTIVTLIRKSEK